MSEHDDKLIEYIDVNIARLQQSLLDGSESDINTAYTLSNTVYALNQLYELRSNIRFNHGVDLPRIVTEDDAEFLTEVVNTAIRQRDTSK